MIWSTWFSLYLKAYFELEAVAVPKPKIEPKSDRNLKTIRDSMLFSKEAPLDKDPEPNIIMVEGKNLKPYAYTSD